MVVFITVKVSCFISPTGMCTQAMWAILLRTHATYICDTTIPKFITTG